MENKVSGAASAARAAAAGAIAAAAAHKAATYAAEKAKIALEDQEREEARKTQEMAKDKFFRINMTLPIELDRVLEDMGTEARSSGGFKVPKTTIIRSLIRVARILQVDMTGVKTEQDMLDRLLEAVRRYNRK